MESTKQISKIAIMACLLFVVFSSFSQILYVEAITLVVVLFACVFPLKEAVMSSIIFALLNMLVQGITPFTFMYLCIYPTYSFLISLNKQFLLRHTYLLFILIGLFSFLTGQLLDLPFILFSAKVTLFYIILGLKTSLIQGTISGIIALFLFEPIYKILIKIERKS